jgi:hypothetical protein
MKVAAARAARVAEQEGTVDCVGGRAVADVAAAAEMEVEAAEDVTVAPRAVAMVAAKVEHRKN